MTFPCRFLNCNKRPIPAGDADRGQAVHVWGPKTALKYEVYLKENKRDEWKKRYTRHITATRGLLLPDKRGVPGSWLRIKVLTAFDRREARQLAASLMDFTSSSQLLEVTYVPWPVIGFLHLPNQQCWIYLTPLPLSFPISLTELPLLPHKFRVLCP